MKSLPKFSHKIYSTLNGNGGIVFDAKNQYYELSDILPLYSKYSLSDSSTWQFAFGRNGFIITDTCYIDEDYNMFYDEDVALDKMQHGERVKTQVWRMTAVPDRPLTKGDKRAILALAREEQEEERKLSEVLGHEVFNIEEG